ncbi:hypothetical protein [Sinomicrobium weinanense]|uniref:Lipoprotein n=1 Tax=Sinomicrobium weinanense TaxID=2842200 RepID=A0A926Q4R4_9FLAO|nr:hypothetical protein [Sinomicrobium weinanense]MBC9798264.1 hypothetical protein [Sinomicrobium weinanense]MBU3125330.1 hypothetical protein [Sinomicrobium weinanense]
MKKSLKIIAILAFCGTILVSCGNSNAKDVSGEPEYVELANNIFFTNQPLYYYKYTDGNGVQTDYFLSSDPSAPGGERVEDIPKGSHIKVSKVYEVTGDDGNKTIRITGEVFPAPTTPLEYETVWTKDNPVFESRK